ncbi:glycosyltransferase-like domain-containing protein 1 isoform X2 [Neocloeon triangulifer]|uniref:glycosyltransferase-like domain-containing protein 1 isoform X2 n=1 Tax=Neocloeon triangulifer TaxID=2078957 RepID=UPI00286ED953|nr:glycosyltransferase-like domain-containing protein 1 isoform X2 [Neocloeon triangulifer]
MTAPQNLIVEVFYGGSHKQLLDIVIGDKKWHWKARTGALTVLDKIPLEHNFKVIFVSSVLNLAELLALRPDLQNLRKIVYFHENQLVYPVKQQKERDFQYGYNQILTCLVADVVLFNSEFNKNSFLSNISKFMKIQPGPGRPKGLKERIEPKCSVLYFPIHVDALRSATLNGNKKDGLLHLLWPHRWEHDKDPEMFARVLLSLHKSGLDFRVSMLGKVCSDFPESLVCAKDELNEKVLHCGFVESKDEYLSILHEADIVISTAKHEFFGVAMMEAVISGCHPLCPNAIVYPEIYPTECLYENEEDLFNRLAKFCSEPRSARISFGEIKIDVEKFSDKVLLPEYAKLFNLF